MYDWDGNCLCMDCVGPEPPWPVSLCKHVRESIRGWPAGHTCGAWQCAVCPEGCVPCLNERDEIPRCPNGEC